MAVLRAPARLEADDALDLDLVTVVAKAHVVGQLQQLLESVVAGAQHLDEVVVAERLPVLEHLHPGARQDVGAVVGVRAGCLSRRGHAA